MSLRHIKNSYLSFKYKIIRWYYSKQVESVNPTMFIYCGLRKMWCLLFRDPFCYLITLLMMYANNVRHGRFHTNGIPIISVSRKNGGGIIVDDSLRMNNGNAGNNIGFSCRCTLIATDGAFLHIHENVGMSQTTICAIGADITIGRHTLLGGGVKIYSSNFHSLNYTDRRNSVLDKKNRKSAPVVIGEDCFIGAGTIILKGVTIGDRTIIGAGSVVTSSIPADCIAAGNPCKVIKPINREHCRG